MKSDMKNLFFAVVALVFSSASFAQSSIFDDMKGCLAGTIETALDQYNCGSKLLASLEQDLDKSLKELSKSKKNIEKEEAVKELQERIIKTQNAWILYRDGQCHENYYTNAPVHPPSQSASIRMCQIEKTKQRIAEVKSSKIE